MISVILISLLCLTFVFSQAGNTPFIHHGAYNDQMKTLDFDIAQDSGCMDDRFGLNVGPCYESYPVRCASVDLLVSPGKMDCKTQQHRIISIKLHEVGLDGSYYDGASLVIHGATGSKISIKLPEMSLSSLLDGIKPLTN